MVSFLKQGLGMKASAVKLYPNFPWVHPSGMTFFLRLVSIWTGARCPVVTFVKLNIYATALMVVEAASSEHTLSVALGHDIGLSVLALSIADYTLLKLENKKRHLRKQAR